MALPAIVSSLSEVPEALQGEYVQGDGSPARPDTDRLYLEVTPTDGFALENTTGLLKTVSTLRNEVRTLKQDAKAWDGLDPAEARDAIENREANAGTVDENELKRKLEAQRKQLNEAHEQEKSTWTKERTEIEEALNVAVIDADVTSKLNGKGSVELLLPIVRRHARATKTDSGNRVARYFDSEGNEMLSRRPGSTGEPMGTEEFIEQLRTNAAYAPAFQGSGPAGSGTPGTGEGREVKGTQRPKIDPSLSPAERLKAHRAMQANKREEGVAG